MAIDWKGFDAPYQRKKVVLPTYPFQRKRYWVKEVPKPAFGLEKLYFERHPLLVHQIETPALANITIFESEMNVKWPDFVKDHLIYQIPIVAGATYVSTLLAAAKLLLKR